MRICIGGRNNIAVHICKYLQTILPQESIFAIPGRNDEGKDNYQRSFLKYINKEGIQVVTLQDIYDWDDLIFLSLEFDRIIIPNKFKSKRLFNIHFSLLPAYKGVFTSALPILYGEQYGGVTFHYIERGIDTGDIIDQVKFEIPSNYKAIDLYLRCIDEGTALVIKNINNVLYGNVKATPQPKKGSTYYSTNVINYASLSINLNATASQIDCQIRAFSYRPFQLPKFGNSFVDKYKNNILQYALVILQIEFFMEFCFNNKCLYIVNGYSLIHFIIIYLLGRAAFENKEKVFRLSAGKWIALYILMVVSILATRILGGNRMNEYAFAYSNPLVICQSFFLFFAFLRISLDSKIINWIASSSLFVYLLQITHPVFDFLCNVDIYLKSNNEYMEYLFLVTGVILIYFLLATLYGKLVGGLIDRLTNPIGEIISNKTHRFFKSFS